MRSRHVPLPIAAVVALAVLWAQPASAQPYPPYPPPGHFVPRVTGALRLGADIPYGDAFSGMPLERLFETQFGILGELGVRVSPQVTLGGYLGFGFGSAGDRYDSWCSGDCEAYSFRAGFLAQYAFAPWSAVSPWIGYGFGFTSSVASGDDFGFEFSYSYGGIDVAHLMAGIDLRPVGPMAIGFYVDYTVGMYLYYDWEEFHATIADGTIGDPKIHQWLSIGPRISF